jgi:hypothetical protein
MILTHTHDLIGAAKMAPRTNRRHLCRAVHLNLCSRPADANETKQACGWWR